jgi:hypothetical protein
MVGENLAIATEQTCLSGRMSMLRRRNDPKHKFHSKPLTITSGQCRSRTHKNILYGKSDNGADTTVTRIHDGGVVVDVGLQDTGTKSPSSGRGSDGASVTGLARRGAQTWHGCC